jgi:hypothetical protein
VYFSYTQPNGGLGVAAATGARDEPQGGEPGDPTRIGSLRDSVRRVGLLGAACANDA